jgi:tRNA pseudouridine55 synthase
MKAGRSGLLVVDKGEGITSFAVVARLRRVLAVVKIGHGGTLDPGATGVLPILIGEATKLSPYLVDHDKEYQVTVRLDVMTDTHDLTGTVVATVAVPPLPRAEIERACASLVGVIAQVPPMYSAVHHEGRRLYELARAGLEVERAPRDVVVRSILVEAIDLPRLTLRIVCGKGTYVRALAADLGRALGVGGAVERLVRTRVGSFRLEDAVPWSTVATDDPTLLWGQVQPPDAGLEAYPSLWLEPAATRGVLHGQSLPAAGPEAGVAVRLYGDDRRFLGIGRMLPGGRVKPERLLHADHPGTRVLPV